MSAQKILKKPFSLVRSESISIPNGENKSVNLRHNFRHILYVPKNELILNTIFRTFLPKNVLIFGIIAHLLVSLHFYVLKNVTISLVAIAAPLLYCNQKSVRPENYYIATCKEFIAT